MALIKCSECGHEVSDKASACPNCGCPIEASTVCKECGTTINETDEVCPNCGCPIEAPTVCKECGTTINETDEVCPNCGCPIQGEIAIHKSQIPKSPRKSDNKKYGIPSFVLIWIFFMLFILFIFLIINTNTSEASRREKENTKLTNALATIEDYSTIDKTKNLLEGSIWTYTRRIGDDDKFNMWCKLVFENGKLYFYMVSPSKGEWGTPAVCDYTVEEERYSNTGERFISVNWRSLMDYSFVPETTALYYKTSHSYKFVWGAYLTKEDKNPWY